MSDAPAGQGFASGTLIATPAGPRRVETLAIGDEVLDATGTPARVTWVGRLALGAAYLASRPDARPIRVQAGALGEGLPERDLIVAPLTELHVNVPGEPVVTLSARIMLNEINMRRDTGQPDGLELFEVELEGAACGLIAEGVPAGRLLPRHTTSEYHIACCRTRAWVHTRAGCLPGPLLGRVDMVDHGVIYGWAMDEKRPWMRIGLEVLINGRIHAATMAAMRRNDLVQAGVGDGHCGFQIELDPPLPTDRTLLVQVRRAGDGVDLPGSPVLLSKSGGPAEILESLNPKSPARAAAARDVLRAGLDKLQAAKG